jgi:hypothetical protein
VIIQLLFIGALLLQAFSHGAALSFTSALLPADVWRQFTVAASVVSTLGIVLFSGIWPGAPNRKLSQIDTAIALVINVVLLVAVAAGYPNMSNV